MRKPVRAGPEFEPLLLHVLSGDAAAVLSSSELLGPLSTETSVQTRARAL